MLQTKNLKTKNEQTKKIIAKFKAKNRVKTYHLFLKNGKRTRHNKKMKKCTIYIQEKKTIKQFEKCSFFLFGYQCILILQIFLYAKKININ